MSPQTIAKFHPYSASDPVGGSLAGFLVLVLVLVTVIVALLTGALAGHRLAQRQAQVQQAVLADRVRRWRYRALHDPLTGLANRAAATEWLTTHHGSRYSLVFVDLDAFKRINDGHGHDTGDLVLQHVAEHLHLVVDGHGLAVRLGGDEFLLACDRPEMGYQLARRAAARLRALPARTEHATITVTASFGVTVVGADGTASAALARAEAAAYRAKHLPSHVAAYDPHLDGNPHPTGRPALRRRDTTGGAR